jgi:hypothetical protein
LRGVESMHTTRDVGVWYMSNHALLGHSCSSPPRVRSGSPPRVRSRSPPP